MEAEFDPAHPVTETDWVLELSPREGFRVCVAQAWLDRG